MESIAKNRNDSILDSLHFNTISVLLQRTISLTGIYRLHTVA